MIFSILLLIFLALAIVYFFLRRAINRNNVVRIEEGSQVDIYVNDTLVDSFHKSF